MHHFAAPVKIPFFQLSLYSALYSISEITTTLAEVVEEVVQGEASFTQRLFLRPGCHRNEFEAEFLQVLLTLGSILGG